MSELPAPDSVPDVVPQTAPPLETQEPPPLEHQEPLIDTTRETNGSAKVRPIACPDCGSDDVKCYSSKPRVRYYRCKTCQNRFKMPRKAIQRVQGG